jgi:gluconolactonase
MVDIPYGRILKYNLSSGEFSLVCQYDGEPNGLALMPDGRLVVADYKEGIVSPRRTPRAAQCSRPSAKTRAAHLLTAHHRPVHRQSRTPPHAAQPGALQGPKRLDRGVQR